MAASLKAFFSKSKVKQIGESFARVDFTFPLEKFVSQASDGLEKLELLARAKHICATLKEVLPQEYPQALEIIVKSLGERHQSDELEGAGMEPFFYLPHTMFVGTYGLDKRDLKRSLEAQFELTQRFTCEWSIRGFLEKFPSETEQQLRLWARHKSPHVRRLVSEGTRTRLPWATRIPNWESTPQRIVDLLELLKNDDASVVRRSVANNLNDLSKHDATLVLELCSRWLKEDSTHRPMVEHALRTLLKNGNIRALKLMGQAARASLRVVAFRSHHPLGKGPIHIGENVELNCEIENKSKRAIEARVDLKVHFVKANGKTSPKVFRLKTLSVGAQTCVLISKVISLKQHTTRKHHAGEHTVECVVNGVPCAQTKFLLM